MSSKTLQFKIVDLFQPHKLGMVCKSPYFAPYPSGTAGFQAYLSIQVIPIPAFMLPNQHEISAYLCFLPNPTLDYLCQFEYVKGGHLEFLSITDKDLFSSQPMEDKVTDYIL